MIFIIIRKRVGRGHSEGKGKRGKFHFGIIFDNWLTYNKDEKISARNHRFFSTRAQNIIAI